jgi:predicted SprT family Zn-dependent metalloprotease
MRLLRQLEFGFRNTAVAGIDDSVTAINPESFRGGDNNKQRNVGLEEKARELLHANGAGQIAMAIRVEWNARLKTCAGRADYRSKLILLNPQLVHYPSEIDRTLRHELGHILAKFRAGRRRILPHGIEWRKACHDLGIADEKRCHNLPFPVKQRARRYLYRCPNCQRDFPRVRRVKRVIACLACCRAHNGGEFDGRFRLRPVESTLL